MIISFLQFARMLSKTAEYAIRAMTALRNQPSGGPMLAREISEITGIPQNYLSKVMHTLARDGLVTSERGRGGGFSLRRSPKAISVFEIVNLFDDLGGENRCFLGQQNCSEEASCAAHSRWKNVWDVYEAFLTNTTLDNLAEDAIPLSVNSGSKAKKGNRK